MIAEGDEDFDGLAAEEHSGLIPKQFRLYFDHFIAKIVLKTTRNILMTRNTIFEPGATSLPLRLETAQFDPRKRKQSKNIHKFLH